MHRSPRARSLRVALPLLASCLVALPSRGVVAQPEPAALEISTAREGPWIAGVPVTLEVRALDAEGAPTSPLPRPLVVEGVERDGAPVTTLDASADGSARLEGVVVPSGVVRVAAPSSRLEALLERSTLPGFLTLVPPFVAISLAVLTRQVLLALFAGIWSGALLLGGFDPLAATLRSADTYLVGSLGDTDHAHILLFSLTLAGLVGIITRTGGVRGIVDVIARYARGRRSGQVSTWLLGLVVFFDDYANVLIVGNTMRPFTDRVRISREKLAFIVDATAAPVATVGVISTWTAYQIGLVGDALGTVEGGPAEPYAFFLWSIPVSFYSFFMLSIVLLSAATLRDFGPMRRAEMRAARDGHVHAPGAQPLLDASLDDLGRADDVVPRWYNAAVPIACVVGFTLLGLWSTGSAAAGPGASLREIIGEADAYRGLLWASVGATFVAMVMALAQRYALAKVVDAWVQGAKSLILAAMILVLAWAIGDVCRDLDTGGWVVTVTRDLLSPRWVPLLAFFSAGVIAFATGTSYGTMAILVPILLPLSFELSRVAELAPGTVESIAIGTLAAILGGAVFGDHCSPISDTTVLSSMASGSDHIDHVRTQIPYALLAAAVVVPSYVALGYGVPGPVVLGVGLAATAGLFFTVSRSVDGSES